MIRYLPSRHRAAIAPLFAHHRHLRVIVDAVLQGHCGAAVAGPGREVEAAQLTAGVFTFFGGDPALPVAQTLVERLSGERIIVSSEGGWRDAILQTHGERAGTEKRLAFSSTDLDPTHLRTLAIHVPDRFRIERITVDLAQRIRAEVDPDLMLPDVFTSPADFAARGFGFCALAAGQMVSAATSAFVSDGAIEIQINTNRAYRRLGLATAVGATLLLHCLEQGIDPHWDTGDPASERVAEKLGYVPDSAYEWLLLHAEAQVHG